MIYLIGSTLLVAALLFMLDGRERAIERPFNEDDIGDDLDAYLDAEEARIEGIREGTQKQIIWADPNQKSATRISVIYIHGYTATMGEIRPVPDLVAQALDANLYYTRLTGHGLDGDSLAKARRGDWQRDMEEAIAIGRELGEKVLILSTSTGSAAAVCDVIGAANEDDILGIVQISPNYRLHDPRSFVLDWPFARWIAPLVAGRRQKAKYRSDQQAHFWDMEFPTKALVQMAALTRAARNLDFSATRLPSLFIYCDGDTIIDVAEMRRVMDAWGGPVEAMQLEWQEGDDIERHVMTGDILTPAKTAPVAAEIIRWAKSIQDKAEHDQDKAEHRNSD